MRVSMTGMRRNGERPVSAVPFPVMGVLVVALAAQLLWHGSRGEPVAMAAELPSPPAIGIARVMALGENAALSRVLMIWLHAFDNQPGISIPFRQLDYGRVRDWLDLALALDPGSRYPLLSAARVYTQVPDPQRQRLMLAFVQEKFLLAPAERWPWMAHAVYVAMHRLHDRDLALELARELRVNTRPGEAPAWARQFELFVREGFGDLEGAQILLGGLIESGEVTDPAERRFLEERLGMDDH